MYIFIKRLESCVPHNSERLKGTLTVIQPIQIKFLTRNGLKAPILLEPSAKS